MDLIFVRHAESLGNAEGRLQGRADSGLSDQGRLQASRLGERLVSEGYEPTHIYSSPLSRTFDTARIASGAWDRPITPWEDLIEIDVGVFSGLTWEEVGQRYRDLMREFARTRDWDRVEGAETTACRRARAARVIQRAVSDHSNGDRVLAFTHGGIMQYIFAAAMGTERLWGIRVRNTAIFEFTLDVDRWHQNGQVLSNPDLWRIVRFNDASHLA